MSGHNTTLRKSTTVTLLLPVFGLDVHRTCEVLISDSSIIVCLQKKFIVLRFSNKAPLTMYKFHNGQVLLIAISPLYRVMFVIICFMRFSRSLAVMFCCFTTHRTYSVLFTSKNAPQGRTRSTLDPRSPCTTTITPQDETTRPHTTTHHHNLHATQHHTIQKFAWQCSRLLASFLKHILLVESSVFSFGGARVRENLALNFRRNHELVKSLCLAIGDLLHTKQMFHLKAQPHKRNDWYEQKSTTCADPPILLLQ